MCKRIVILILQRTQPPDQLIKHLNPAIGLWNWFHELLVKA